MVVSVLSFGCVVYVDLFDVCGVTGSLCCCVCEFVGFACFVAVVLCGFIGFGLWVGGGLFVTLVAGVYMCFVYC